MPIPGFLLRFGRSPYLGLVTGIVLLVAAASEIVDTLDEPRLGAHHGVFVFALGQLLRSLAELQDAARGIADAHDTLDERAGAARD